MLPSCYVKSVNLVFVRGTNVIPTTTLKSSSSDLLMYFWKSNFVSLPGARCAWKQVAVWWKVQISKRNLSKYLTPMVLCVTITYRYKSMSKCHVISLGNRSKELSEETDLRVSCKRTHQNFVLGSCQLINQTVKFVFFFANATAYNPEGNWWLAPVTQMSTPKWCVSCKPEPLWVCRQNINKY